MELLFASPQSKAGQEKIYFPKWLGDTGTRLGDCVAKGTSSSFPSPGDTAVITAVVHKGTSPTQRHGERQAASLGLALI